MWAVAPSYSLNSATTPISTQQGPTVDLAPRLWTARSWFAECSVAGGGDAFGYRSGYRSGYRRGDVDRAPTRYGRWRVVTFAARPVRTLLIHRSLATAANDAFGCDGREPGGEAWAADAASEPFGSC